jgi:hypothetical protein
MKRLSRSIVHGSLAGLLLLAGAARAQDNDDAPASAETDAPKVTATPATTATAVGTDADAASAPPQHWSASSCDRPRWSVRAGLLFWERSDPDDRPLVTFPGLTPLLDARSFDYDSKTGFELALSRRLGECWDIELRYLQVDDWRNSVSTGLSGLSGFLATTPPTTLVALGAGLAKGTVTSELESAEIMPWYRLGERFRVGAGFRWVRFDDSFRLDLFRAVDGAAALIDFGANNDLYGFQVGGDAALVRFGPVSLDAVGKIGIYGNNARQAVFLEDPVGDPASRLQLSASDCKTSFVGEWGLSAGYAITQSVVARVGYNLLWIDGLALGTEQVAATGDLGVAGPRATVDRDGDVFIHGWTIGLELRW